MINISKISIQLVPAMATHLVIFMTSIMSRTQFFEYIPTATKNVGKQATVAFWKSVHNIMHEEIQDHRSFVSSDRIIAVEAPIDFFCKKDIEWAGVKHKAGTSFRVIMSAFYDISTKGKFKYVRVYSIYHPHYQLR